MYSERLALEGQALSKSMVEGGKVAGKPALAGLRLVHTPFRVSIFEANAKKICPTQNIQLKPSSSYTRLNSRALRLCSYMSTMLTCPTSVICSSVYDVNPARHVIHLLLLGEIPTLVPGALTTPLIGAHLFRILCS